MKTTDQIINYLKIHNLWDAYTRNCAAWSTNPTDIINYGNCSVLRYAFEWVDSPEGKDFWKDEDKRLFDWCRRGSTPLRVIHYKDGAITLTGVNSNPSLAGVHFADAEQAREWLAKNTEYEVDYNDLMGLRSSF